VRVLVALGGNAMTGEDGSATPEAQQAAIHQAMQAVADLIADGHDVVLTHGNGPQVGNLLVKNELAAATVPPVPLDWCGAQTQGTIGFTIMNELEPALARRGVDRPVATLVSRTRVDADDPAFQDPAKPVGRFLTREEAEPLIALGQNWQDLGPKGWRRVVPSPEPREILETRALRALLDRGFVVVAAGGGGIPVVREPDGSLRGVEAVIDKDLTAALLARSVEADVLVIATDVEHAMINYGTPEQEPVRDVDVDRARELVAEGHFARGSMGPKMEAAIRFASSGDGFAVITSLEAIRPALRREVGTIVQRRHAQIPNPDPTERVTHA
jgi:carbamate kinase